MSKLVLDSSKMPANEFYEKFEILVGCSEKEWTKKDTVKSNNTGETYEYKDDKFCLGGSAYSTPVLYIL